MKTGRNDLCLCGSGKKFKQCCLKTEQAQPESAFLWRRIRRVIDDTPRQMLEFAIAHFGSGASTEAWNDFMQQKDEVYSPNSPQLSIFMPWFLFDWLPDPLYTSVKPGVQDGRTAGQAYLAKKAHQLDPLLVRYIEQCCATPFSYFDVLAVRPGEGIALRDIFTGTEIYVTEQSASRQAKVGDITFSKVVTIDSVSLIESCAPYLFQPVEKGALVTLRQKMERNKTPLTPEVLREYSDDLLSLYHAMTDRALNPVMPQIHNTDDEPMLPHRIVYGIDSPRAAFDALHPLCLTDRAKELLRDAHFDSRGDLHSIDFPWQKRGNAKNDSWDNTILGHIKIDGLNMNIEVNSENRAKQIRGLVEKMLPGARYKTTVITPLQSMLARSRKQGETPASREHQIKQDELNSLPEVQAKIAEYMRQHYRKWTKEKLPALNGKTPMQAVKTKDGKEIVRSLLLEIERSGARSTPPLDLAIIDEVRKQLGLS